MEKVLAMKGGDGDLSYTHNSSVQLRMMEAIMPILERAINENKRMHAEFIGGKGGVFRVADLGCATGKNTILAAETIVGAVQSMYRSIEKEVPEIEVYFTDLPSNDFNSLFRILPPQKESSDIADEDDKKPLATRSYFAAAVCGSYFRRLFPRRSLHFCLSSVSLHWLSQVPESVQDRSSPAWSGTHVYVSSDCNLEVGGAFLSQFEKDMTSFLRARAEEIVVGGSIFITLLGRKSGTHIMEEQGSIGNFARRIEYAFEELFNEGLIEKEIWESFNIPCFAPNSEELRSIVEREGSFGIESDVTVIGGFSYPMTTVGEGEEEMFGTFVANHSRTLIGNIVEAHLGCENLANEFFSRIAKRASAKFPGLLRNHEQPQAIAITGATKMKPLVTCDNRYAISHSPCVNTRPSSSNHNSCNTHRIKIANRVHDSYAAKVNRNINVRNSNTNRIHKTYSYGGPNIDMVGQINDSQMNINKIYSRYDGTHKFTAGRKNTTSNGNPIHNNFNFNRMCNSHGGTNITSVGQIKDSNMNIKKSFNCYDGTHKFLANTNSNVNPMLNNFYANFNPLYNNLNANAYNNKNRASNSVKTHMNASKTCSSYDANNNPAPVKQNNSIVSINIIFSYYDGAHKIPARLKNTKRHNLNANFNPVYKDSNTNVNNNSNRIKSKTHMNANKTYNSYDDSNNPTSAGQINRLVLSNDKRLKVNRSSDRDFYSFPRFVTHVDDAFISSLTELYRERIPPGAEVLDLMSSWISHLPPEIQYKRVVGHGLNAQELARNPRLDYFFVKDLNEDQTLEAEDCSFDAVLCTVSVQYLQQPEKVFAEIYRILRPGGLCIVSFSNRMFYEKAISAWREGTDYSKIQLVVQYFQCVTGFTQPETVKKIPKSEANSPFGWLLRLLGRMTSDPFYAVIAYRNFKTV